MKIVKNILICTQIIDRPDSTLGFFCRWVLLLSERFDRTHVICLKEGQHNFPTNVSVHSLGKEKVAGSGFIQKLHYAIRFYRQAWQLRKEYDIVFVHMNEEYVLLGGILWWLLGKKVFMWRNHYKGTILTDIASIFCYKILCTSKFSYTARYKKTIFMPVGVDEESYELDESVPRIPHSVFSLGRISKSKRPYLLIEALAKVAQQNIEFTAKFVGGAIEAEPDYPNQMMELAKSLKIADRLTFTGAVPNTETYRYYRSGDIYVNCSPSGMLDKTIFEAAVCKCLVLVSSQDFAELVGPDYIFADNDSNDLAQKLAKFLTISPEEHDRLTKNLTDKIKPHRLSVLIDRLDDLLHQ